MSHGTTTSPSSPPIPPPPSWAPIVGELVLAGVALLVLLWRNWFQPRLTLSRIKFRYTVRQDLEIKSVLSQILILLAADRVLLCEFHNGQTTASRRSDLRVTATQEDVQPGVSRIASTVSNMPVAQLAKELAVLEDGKLHSFSLNQDLPEKCRRHLISIGVCALREQLLIDGSEVLGILTIHYCRLGRTDLLDRRCTCEIRPLGPTELQQYDRLRLRLIELMRHRSIWFDQLKEWLGL